MARVKPVPASACSSGVFFPPPRVSLHEYSPCNLCDMSYVARGSTGANQSAARSDAPDFMEIGEYKPADVKLFPSFTLASPNATQNNVQDGWMSRRSPGLSCKDNSKQRGLAPTSNFLCISAIKLRMFRGRR